MNLKDNFTLNIALAQQNKELLCQSIKLVIAKKHPSFLKNNLAENSKHFLNPLVFAYLNNIDEEEYSTEKVFNSIFRKEYKYSTIDCFENLLEVPSYIKTYYFEMYRGKTINPNPKIQIEDRKNYDIVKALTIIQNFLPKMYEELVLSNSVLVCHDNPKVINFVTKSFHGALSFWIKEEVTVLYFIEEFIHQGSHNYLNFIFHPNSCNRLLRNA